MRIAIDVDGVLRQFQQYAVQRWNENHPAEQRLNVNNWTAYDWFYKAVGGRDEAFQWWISQGVFSDAPPYECALEGVKLLSQEHECIILSSQMHDAACASQTLAWLYKHGFFPLVKEIHFGHDKNVVDFDVMIDDDPRFIKAALEKAPHICCIAFGSPWNRSLLCEYESRLWYLHDGLYWKKVATAMPFIERRVNDIKCSKQKQEPTT